MYHVLPAHVRHTGSRTSKQKRFVATLRDEFTSFLDDAEQFLLWACAAALDSRQKDLQWAAVVWENDHNWPKVTGHWRDLRMPKKEVWRNIKEQVAHHTYTWAEVADDATSKQSCPSSPPPLASGSNWMALPRTQATVLTTVEKCTKQVVDSYRKYEWHESKT